ncbi:MAG: GTP cyclohydrolase [Legionellaceae bacterium]|nr:GTP cyclohydrolase [Legionellaceae bacterium]
MLIVELTYLKPLEEVDKVLQAHRAFLQTCYDKGLFLASGPKNPRTGGIIIALTDQKTMKTLIEQDPFHQAGVAEYKITEFEPVKRHEVLDGILS